jgi:hypothetical protein
MTRKLDQIIHKIMKNTQRVRREKRFNSSANVRVRNLEKRKNSALTTHALFFVMLNIEKDYPSNDFLYSCLPK